MPILTIGLVPSRWRLQNAKCQHGAKPVPRNSTVHFTVTRKAWTTGSCLAGSTTNYKQTHTMLGLHYLDGIANWGPWGPLRAGFGNSGWHDGWPQGLGSRLEATLQPHLPRREVWRLEAGCTAGRGWSLGLLHLRLRIRQRVHDGGGNGHRGQEVVRDLGKKAGHLCWCGCCRHSTTPSSYRLPKPQ